MDLLPSELKATLPALYSQENHEDPVVHFKYFTPDSNWMWLVTEGSVQEDGDFIFFGCVCGFEEEWGYFTLRELQSVRGPRRLPIVRDVSFTPRPFSEVIRYRKQCCLR